MNRKYTLLMLLLLALPSGLMAQKTDVSVLCLDGTAYTLKMSEVERIEIGSGTVGVVPVAGESRTWQTTEIDRIALTANGSGIRDTKTVEADIRFGVIGSTVSVAGAPDGTYVELYDAAGRLVGSTVSRDGKAAIDASRNAAGTYIVKAGQKAQKLIKK
ncbi:MAG: T9SS type A sorting domain-containing protein [Prevotella sp.]|nr:T9SS type A sorting domain-containing protein [Prevotella sp.]